MIPSERLKRLHDLAQQTKRQEQEISERALADLREGNERINARLIELRLRELRGWMMTDAELADDRDLEREIELDRADEDWTR